MHALGKELKKTFEVRTEEVKFDVEFLQLKEEGTVSTIINLALIECLSNNKTRLKEFRILVDGTFRILPTYRDKNGQFVTFQVLY